MNDLKETLDSHVQIFTDEESTVGELTQLAQRWAAFTLKTHTGELLRKGLEISRALSEFDVELMGKEPQ